MLEKNSLFYKKLYLFEALIKKGEPEFDDYTALQACHYVYCEELFGFDNCDECVSFFRLKDEL